MEKINVWDNNVPVEKSSYLCDEDIIFFNEDNLEIQYEVVGQKKDEENNNSEFFKKIENYFKGEN